MTDDFVLKVRTYFSQFDSTLSLVDKLIQSRSHPQEILILICSRLDALANSTATVEQPQRGKFIDFLTRYGAKGDFWGRVSIGDLYYEIGYHRWVLPGLIPRAGRLHNFSDANREVTILLNDNGVELTMEGCDRLLSKIQRCLSTRYRARSGQPRSRAPLATTRNITDTLVSNIRGLSPDVLKKIPTAVAPLLTSKTAGAILYQRFRSEVIHGGKVLIDENRFFLADEPYWKPLFSEYFGSFLFLEFPVPFLRQLLNDCIRTFERHVNAKRKVPPSIHFEMFPDDVFDHLDWLDQDLLPPGRDIRLNIPRR